VQRSAGMNQRSSRPLVVLTTSVELESGVHGRPAVFLYTSYQGALEQVGLGALLLTPAHTAESVAAIMALADGLVLSGGEDVDPAHYGETPRVRLDSVHPARDAMELHAFRLASEYGVPVLGICRGCQLINVALGGTLYQDIPTCRPGSLGHAQDEGWERRTHDVHVQPGSLLERVAAQPLLRINSFHHQAVRDVAPGLNVSGRAEDGLVEAVEADDGRWVLGVQWHPERFEATTPDDDADRRIFAAFADAVRARLAQSA
jgi:putative glutamine amidotransferase